MAKGGAKLPDLSKKYHQAVPVKGRSIAVQTPQMTIKRSADLVGLNSAIKPKVISITPMRRCNISAASGPIPAKAKKGSQASLPTTPQAPWKRKFIPTAILRIQKMVVAGDCSLGKGRREALRPGLIRVAID